jgi:DNA-3-methyladenine glycosylase
VRAKAKAGPAAKEKAAAAAEENAPKPRARTPRPALPPLPSVTLAELRAARLPRSFYARDVAEVARALIGCAIVHGERAAVIVETEAYGGPEDLASHARFGPTSRNAAMFGPPGHAYVYLCYGTHQMFNVSTGTDGVASAVLIRATTPRLVAAAAGDAAGHEIGAPHAPHALDPAAGRGPGKLTSVLGIDRSLNLLDLTAAEAPLWLAALPHPAPLALDVGPRVGVDFAGEFAKLPLRFAWRAHPSVSRPAPSTPWP